jgi:hypothetical protein
MTAFNINGGKDPVEASLATLRGSENEPPDPFNLKSLALSQDYLMKAGVTKLLTTIAVDKPKSQFFFRIHPDPEFRDVYGILKMQGDGKIGNDFYIVAPNMLPELQGEFYPATLYVGVTKQHNLFVWPIRLPEEGGRVNDWSRTSMIAAEKAMTTWVRVVANQGAGCNDIFLADADLGEPKWPDLPYAEILRIAFRSEGIIGSPDHPVVKKLRGRI